LASESSEGHVCLKFKVFGGVEFSTDSLDYLGR
jgi:hypothetical protein